MPTQCAARVLQVPLCIEGVAALGNLAYRGGIDIRKYASGIDCPDQP